MVRAIEQEQEIYRSRLFHFKGTYENSGGRHTKSKIIDYNFDDESLPDMEDRVASRSHCGGSDDKPLENQQIGVPLNKDKAPKSRLATENAPRDEYSSADVDMMKERFAKLLLGEDMSGGGKGVSSALALSNAITNLAASVFGEQGKLEPMSPERKTRWRKEIEWLLSVTDHIVEFVPSQQKSKDGVYMEIMVTRQRTDILMNIPALRKLDAMLIDCLDNFKDQNEFTYMSDDADESEKRNAKRKDDKWWLPTPKVPPNGLSEVTKKWLHVQKDSVNQVLKAAMAINAQTLAEMEIPENYIESLPKNGRASLGDLIYKSITEEYFDPGAFLATMDLSSEHKILDLKNRIEASIVIWRRKMSNKDGKSWGSAVKLEKRELFEERAETILLLLKQRFPGTAQSTLDINKIQYNRDVGQAVLESYSRILESLASTVMSRIEDVLYADSLLQDPSLAEQTRNPHLRDSSPVTKPVKLNVGEELEKLNSADTPTSMTLSDFMGWNFDQGENEQLDLNGLKVELLKEADGKNMEKIANIAIATNKKVSYLETLGGMRSPTARH